MSGLDWTATHASLPFGAGPFSGTRSAICLIRPEMLHALAASTQYSIPRRSDPTCIPRGSRVEYRPIIIVLTSEEELKTVTPSPISPSSSLSSRPLNSPD